MIIPDRGRKKWAAAFILPEHAKIIGRMYDAEYDVAQPQLEEQKVTELNDTLAEAIEFKRTIRVKYYSNNRIQVFQGDIHKYDPINRILHLSANDSIEKLFVYNILEIEPV